MYNVKILADSISHAGARITTMEVTYPRFVHAEFMTHRLFSRNAASSRAIPIEKMIERVLTDPAMPKWWGKNQKGMQAAEELTGYEREQAEFVWLCARDEAVRQVRNLIKVDLHKQIANRLLEPWMFITVIVTATEYENWFHLRCHPDAQPEIRWVAEEMRRLYNENQPTKTPDGEWHRPLISDEDEIEARKWCATNVPSDVWSNEHAALAAINERLNKISVGRCARVSYLTHDGKRDHAADIELHDRLAKSGHWSPFEHVATPMGSISMVDNDRSGNFIGWHQYRKTFATEHAGRETRRP